MKTGPKPKLYELDGVWRSLTEWAEISGVDSRTLYARIHVCGHSLEQAMSKAVGAQWRRREAKTVSYGGRSLTIHEWAKLTGIPHNTLRVRLDRGWTVEQALSLPTPEQRNRGVVSNLPCIAGTGGGSVAQDRAQIEFSANPEKTSP